jgi:hypothetical protein
MPYGKPAQSLKGELSKISRLSNVQGGLPPIMRGLPVLAILAGEVVSKATNGHNIVERHVLGVDETFLLGAPITEASATTTEIKRKGTREGVKTMCRRCRNGEKGSADPTQNQWLSAEQLSSIYLESWEQGHSPSRCYPAMDESDRHP